MIGAATVASAPATAQDTLAVVRPATGTRLDLSASGSVTRVPDLAIISAGVVTKAPTASRAIADNGDPYLEETPCFIAEVLSKSTESADRGAKLEAYCKITTLERYVLIEQDLRFVTVYSRDGDGWRVAFLDGTGSVEIPCLKATLDLQQIYADVQF